MPTARTTIRVLCALFLLGAMGPLAAQETRYSAYHDYRVTTVVDGLVRPWSLAFLPNGDILVTEKPGRLREDRSIPGDNPFVGQAGGLSGQQVTLLEIEDNEVVREETLVRGIGRVRDVRVGPDGFVYLAIDDREGAETPIVRLEPVPRGPIAP